MKISETYINQLYEITVTGVSSDVKNNPTVVRAETTAERNIKREQEAQKRRMDALKKNNQDRVNTVKDTVKRQTDNIKTQTQAQQQSTRQQLSGQNR